MKRPFFILSCFLALAGSLYAPAARADDNYDSSQISTDTELTRNTDDPQERPEYNKVPGQATPGTAEDPNVYHCGATSACN